MKKIVLFFALLILANSLYSQSGKPSAPLTKQGYLQKSKNQKTAAWLFMGGGVGLTILGATQGHSNDGLSDNTGKAVAIVTGLAAVGVGTMFFILATDNKNKAAGLSFKMENAPMIQQRNFVYHSYPALSFRLNL